MSSLICDPVVLYSTVSYHTCRTRLVTQRTHVFIFPLLPDSSYTTTTSAVLATTDKSDEVCSDMIAGIETLRAWNCSQKHFLSLLCKLPGRCLAWAQVGAATLELAPIVKLKLKLRVVH